jgi:hypothetical protein
MPRFIRPAADRGRLSWRTGFERSGGDVPDWDNTESRERDEDAAWRDLVARFDAPLAGQGPAPWPDREDMPAEPAPAADGVGGPDAARGADGRHRAAEADVEAEPGRHAADGDHGRHAADAEHGRHAAAPDRGLHGPNGKHAPDGFRDESGETSGPGGRHGRPGADGPRDPEVVQVSRRIRGPVARGVPADGTPAEDEEHFIPPAPPPLPKLDPMAKGAWVALFGGPGYLMVATAAGWSVSGLAAFCAVAAFVAGFAILVLRMHDPGPGGPDDGDDGAVV